MEKILEKSGKSQGILSVRKSGNPVIATRTIVDYVPSSVCSTTQFRKIRENIHFVETYMYYRVKIL